MRFTNEEYQGKTTDDLIILFCLCSGLLVLVLMDMGIVGH